MYFIYSMCDVIFFCGRLFYPKHFISSGRGFVSAVSTRGKKLEKIRKKKRKRERERDEEKDKKEREWRPPCLELRRGLL